jgi:hypothetical protein
MKPTSSIENHPHDSEKSQKSFAGAIAQWINASIRLHNQKIHNDLSDEKIGEIISGGSMVTLSRTIHYRKMCEPVGLIAKSIRIRPGISLLYGAKSPIVIRPYSRPFFNMI